MPSTNFVTLSSFVASRRPTFIWSSLTTVSTPGRAEIAQYRTASVPNCSNKGIGVTTLPLDFDIFLRSGSRIQPLSAALPQGSVPNSKWARTTVENSHVRMISGPCGRRSMGNTSSKSSGRSSQCAQICGVNEDVAHVSMTSGSPTNPPG